MAVEGTAKIRAGFIPVIKAYKGLISIAFLLMVFSGFGQSVFFGIYLPDIQNRFGIDKTTLGSIYAAATVLSALAMVWSGKFLDTMPLRRFIVFVLCGLAAGCVVMGLATHPVMLFLAFLLLRQCGQGLMILSGTTAINRYIDEGRGRAQSIAQSGLPVHAALFPLIGHFIIDAMGYSASWLSYSAFILCVLLPLFMIFLRHHESKTHAGWKKRIDDQDRENLSQQSLQSHIPKMEWTRGRVLKDWRFYMIMIAMTIPPCFGTVIFFYQTTIADALGMGDATFAGGFVFLTIASVASALIAGSIMDSLGEKPLLLSFPILYALGLYMLSAYDSVFATYAALSIIGFGGGITSITGGPLFAKMYGTKYYGSIKSLSITAMILASAVSPPLTGYLLDSGIGIAEILFYFAIYSIAAWCIVAAFINKITGEKAI